MKKITFVGDFSSKKTINLPFVPDKLILLDVVTGKGVICEERRKK